MAWVAGVDGCPGGWFVVLKDTHSGEIRHRVVEQFAGLLGLAEEPSIVAVDIPIGLLDGAVRGGRECDRAARELLGQPKARSVFSPPIRVALQHAAYEASNKANRESSSAQIGISRQSFDLRQKLREADEAMTPELQGLVKEIHPEVSFYELNGKRAMKHSKKKRDGLSERQKLLRDACFGAIPSGLREFPRSHVGQDDILDACVACWSAERILKGEAVCVPPTPSRDARGLRMEIWR